MKKNTLKYATRIVGVLVLALLALVLLPLALSLKAQPVRGGSLLSPNPAVSSQSTTTITSGSGLWTNRIAGATAFENDTLVDCTQGKDVALQLSFQMTASSTANITVVLGRSVTTTVGTTNFEEFLAWPVAGNGTARVTACTNISNTLLGAIPYLWIKYITNAHATALVTNYAVYANIK